MDRNRATWRSRLPSRISTGSLLLWPYAAWTIRAVLGLIGLGGSIDFVLSRSEEPGWVGAVLNFFLNPPELLRFATLLLAVYLLFRSEKREIRDELASLRRGVDQLSTDETSLRAAIEKQSRLQALGLEQSKLLFERNVIVEGRHEMERGWGLILASLENSSNCDEQMWVFNYQTSGIAWRDARSTIARRIGLTLEPSLPEEMHMANSAFVPGLEHVKFQDYRQTHRQAFALHTIAIHRVHNIVRSFDERLDRVRREIAVLTEASLEV